MPPEIRVVPRFAAEPSQEQAPYGRWAERLQAELMAACLRIDPGEGEIGTLGEIAWHPDRTWHGRTYVPATAPTDTGLEVFGFVSYVAGDGEDEPTDFHAVADATSETADANPDWTIDLCDEVVGRWRGEEGHVAAMTLVWGRPLVGGAAIATAELAGLCVDQAPVVDGRFTLLAPDDYRADTLDVALFERGGREVARESLYEEDDDAGDGED